MTIDPSDIKIKIKILSGESKTLAQASVTLFDCWTEKGWRIMKSEHLHQALQEYIWIQSPCFKTGMGWTEMVYIEDKKLYEKVHEKIYDAYHIAKAKNQQKELAPKTMENSGNSAADPNDIPF